MENYYSKDEDNLPIVRDLHECIELFKSEDGPNMLSDKEIVLLVKEKIISSYHLETALNNPERGVRIRRQIAGSAGGFLYALNDLPYKNYNYSKVRPL